MLDFQLPWERLALVLSKTYIETGSSLKHDATELGPAILTYCWWFRNPANHLRCIKHCNVINYQPQLVGRISSINSIFSLLKQSTWHSSVSDGFWTNIIPWLSIFFSVRVKVSEDLFLGTKIPSTCIWVFFLGGRKLTIWGSVSYVFMLLIYPQQMDPIDSGVENQEYLFRTEKLGDSCIVWGDGWSTPSGTPEADKWFLPFGDLVTMAMGFQGPTWGTRWWFQMFFIFTPSWGNDPISLILFEMGWNHLGKGWGTMVRCCWW